VVARPSETISAVVGSVVGAALVIVGAYTDLEVTTEVQGAIIVLISWIAAGVTWVVSRRQQAGSAGSAADGAVMWK